jgi:hypothetical protein
MLPYTQNESLQPVAEKITQTRMDIRLAMRAGRRSTVAYNPEVQEDSVAADEGDDTWLNDRVTSWRETVPHAPIHKEQLADDQALACWLTL